MKSQYLSALFLALVVLGACGKKRGTGNGGGGDSGPTFIEYDAYATSKNIEGPVKRMRGTVRFEKIDDKRAKMTVTYADGQGAADVQEFSVEGMPGRDTIAQVMKDCGSMGATPERIDTPMGAMSTCKNQNGGEQYWYGEVPFMLVKRIGEETVNGKLSDVEMTVKDYRW